MNTITLVAVALVFLVVYGLIVLSTYRARSLRPDEPYVLPIKINPSRELFWTILPLLVVLALFLISLRVVQ